MALRQTGNAPLAKLADVVGVRPSSCQRALEVLLADGLVVAVGAGRTREYVLNDQNPALPAVVELANTLVPAKEAFTIVGNANPAVEFIGLTSERALTVFAKRRNLADRSRAVEAITRLADTLKLRPQFLDHQDLEGARDLAVQLREELSRGEALVGNLDRSIPDPRRRTAGRSLGHISPALHLPSARTLQSIKRRHGVRRLKIFGSAVRTDFRPDSDVDIAVTLDPRLRSNPRTLEALEVELERRLGHDVDLVLESQLRPPVRYLVDRESVAL
jgi:predicted nucleotidyltransferase/DNA-binding Lrp family transcriptional regulator